MSNLQKLTDERVSLVAEARVLLDECGDDMPQDKKDQHDRIMARVDELGTEIEAGIAEQEAHKARIAKLAEVEASLRQTRAQDRQIQQTTALTTLQPQVIDQPINKFDAIDNVVNQWAADGRQGVNADDFKASGCDWDNKNGGLSIPLFNQAPRNLMDIKNAQGTTPDTAGGYTVPQGFLNELEIALLQFGGMRQVSRILRTATGNPMDYPNTNDTGNKGSVLAENTQDSEQDVTFGNVVLNAYKYTSNIVRVSLELEQDSAFSMPTLLGRLLGERLGRIENEHATTGTGTGQAQGVVTAAPTGKTAALNTAITIDEILDLESSVDPAYRGMATFMMSDAIRAAVRQLKTTDGWYHWQPSVQAGDPDRLLGYPVQINQDMAGFGASNDVMLFGDFSKYMIREALSVTLRRLVERYADFHQVGYVAICRFDGRLIDAGTGPIKKLSLPA